MDGQAEIEGVLPSAGADALDRPDAGAKVIRGGVIRAIAYGATILLTGGIVPLMTRHLGVADFGRFVTASSIVMIVAGVTEFGLSGIGTREYALAQPAAAARPAGQPARAEDGADRLGAGGRRAADGAGRLPAGGDRRDARLGRRGWCCSTSS